MSRASTETFDGLVVGYGRHTVDNDVPSVYQGANGEVTVSFELDLTTLGSSPADISGPNSIVIPRGSVFTKGFIQTLEAVAASTSLLTLGTWSRGLGTEIVDDADGFIVAIDDALMANVGDVNLMVGGLIADAEDSNLAVAGAISDSDVVFAGDWTTNVFTAGVIRVVVSYVPPAGSAGRALAV